MAHNSLYRRFRPDSFDKVIGQDYVIRTIKNMIKSDSIAHAFLFTGTRGTGKTSIAKIFAKAVNCLEPVDGSPCGKCSVCQALNNPANLDVIEMDAASHNSVDDMRELNESVGYPPTVGRYKVYIMDEAHMITPSAFNAFLKTLEEPPSHVVFILATTDIRKIPETILSRCIRFDFKLVGVAELVGLLKKILKEIGRGFEEEALIAIANAGDGSVRDTLSIADMCLSYCVGDITYREVLEVLGASDPAVIADIAESILEGRVDYLLSKVDYLLSGGKSVTQLQKDVMVCMRNIVYSAKVDNADKLLDLPKNVFEKIKKMSATADINKAVRCVDILAEEENTMRFSAQPRILLEMALVKAAMDEAKPLEKAKADTADSNATLQNAELVKRINELDERVAAMSRGAAIEDGGDAARGRECRAELGQIIQKARYSKYFTLLSALGDVVGSYKIGRVMYLEVDREGSYNYIKEADNIRFMLAALEMKRFNIDSIIVVNVKKEEKNYESEIGEVMSMFDTENDKIVTTKKSK